MHSPLSLPLIVSSQALARKVDVDPLPSTARLSPAELAQAYRAWWFGPGRAGSLIGGTKR